MTTNKKAKLMERHVAFSRRSFLRGLGACIALPAFESFTPASAVASSAAGSVVAPVRSAFLFFPNGAIPSAWQPTGEGSSFEFGRTLQPLEKLRSHVQVLSGLDQRHAEPGP
ncbi:MAG: DUF1552 domain-containing protein, partial [Verrucomicrobia bacterium]|nr:DUF1552 domain-containing protein [Verrucomicrobiota bacterium]